MVEEPKHRSRTRIKLGKLWYGFLRKILWLKKRNEFVRDRLSSPLEYQYISHQTVLLRKLKDVDMWMQENKIVNLNIAAQRLNGVILRPGELFSYWKLIGKPTKRKGYLRDHDVFAFSGKRFRIT